MLELRLGIGDNDAIARMIGVIDSMDIKEIWPSLVKEIIHPFVIRHVRANFDAQGKLGGQNWNYNGEPKYAAYKMAATGHQEVLRWKKGRREILYPSLAFVNGFGHLFRMTSTSVRIGTTVPYAGRLAKGGVNQFGETYPGRNPMKMKRASKKNLVTMIQRGIMRGIAPKGMGIRDVRHSL